HVHLEAVLRHDSRADVDQALGVADLRRPFQRAVDEQRPKSAEVGVDVCHHNSFLPISKNAAICTVSASTSCAAAATSKCSGQSTGRCSGRTFLIACPPAQ